MGTTDLVQAEQRTCPPRAHGLDRVTCASARTYQGCRLVVPPSAPESFRCRAYWVARDEHCCATLRDEQKTRAFRRGPMFLPVDLHTVHMTVRVYFS